MFAPSLAPQWDVWPDCESAVIRLAQLNGHGFALLKVRLRQGSSLAAWTKQGTLLHTMLKRVSGISKWCRFIQGWKIYALGVENLKWQEENFPLHLAWGLRRCIIHGKKRLPDQWMKILRRHGQNDFKLDSFLLQEVALHKFTLSISM